MPQPTNPKTTQKIYPERSRMGQNLKTKTTLDEQIKVAHRMLLAVVAYLMFVAVAVLITPKARPPQVPSQPPVEKITAEHPFGYPRILKYFVPTDPCRDDNVDEEACYQLDNFDLLDFHHVYLVQSDSYQEIKERNPDIVYLMYHLPHATTITAYDAGQWYMRDMMDFFETIWVQDNVDWYYFRSGDTNNDGKTTLRSNIPQTGDDFYITVDNCSDFIEAIAPGETVNSAYIKVWDSDPNTQTNRAGYEIMRVEDQNGDGDVCEPGNQLYVTSSRPNEDGRGRGPSDQQTHFSGENVWNYFIWGNYTHAVELDFTDNRPEWVVKDLSGTDSERYCGMNNGEKCQVTDWLPNYAYDRLFDGGDTLVNGMFWDNWIYGAHNENNDTVSVDFGALDEIQTKFRQTSGEFYSGDDLQQTGNAPTDFEDSEMTGGLVSERDLASEPYYETRNLILEVINRAERWQDVYSSDLPLTIMHCCAYNWGYSKMRFNLLFGNILGGFSGSSGFNYPGDGQDNFYQHWIDEYAVDLNTGEAFITSEEVWNDPEFTAAVDEDDKRHYLGKPVKDKELLSRTLTSDNLVWRNGGFESGTSYWDISTSGGETATIASVSCDQVPGGECVEGSNALKVDIQNTWGRAYNNIKVSNDDLITLTPPNIYTVEFWAKAANPRLFDFGLLQGGDEDFRLLDLYVGTEWKKFLFTFKAEKNVNTVRFYLGRDGEHEEGGLYEGIDVYLDNIIIQQGDGFIGYQRELDNGLILLNPAPSEEGESDIFKVPEGQYKKILGCTGDSHCDRAHNSGEVIDSNNYNCPGGQCELTIDALDGYVLLKTESQGSLDLTLTGDSSVPQGGTMNIQVTVENNTSDNRDFDVWFDLTRVETRENILDPFNDYQLGSGDTGVYEQSLGIPSRAQPDTYTLTAYVGPNFKEHDVYEDSASHEFTVTEIPCQFNCQEVTPLEFEITGSTTRIWREAERATITPPMERAEDPEASDGAYIFVPNGAGDNGMAQYTISIPEAGDYVIWGRVIAENGEDDSFWVKMDEAGFSNLWDLPWTSSWTWNEVSNRDGADPVIFPLTQGAHTLYMEQREDGAKLDKLLITDDLDYKPSGIGE